MRESRTAHIRLKPFEMVREKVKRSNMKQKLKFLLDIS